MEITDKQFWINYWGNIRLPQAVDYNFKNDRVIAETIKRYLPKADYDKRAIEIGCAPGKWLVLLNKELGYKVDGYEYIDIAAQKTRENLVLNNIPSEQFNIVTGDFINDSIQSKYDAVISLGFIEHFQDFGTIMKKHLDLLKDEGILIFGMPNFKGINYPIQKMIDRYLNYKMLPNHNLKTMNLKVYRDFAKRNKLNPLFIRYIGGFEGGLFNIPIINNKIVKKIMIVIVNLFHFIFDRVNTKFTSSYILAVMKK